MALMNVKTIIWLVTRTLSSLQATAGHVLLGNIPTVRMDKKSTSNDVHTQHLAAKRIAQATHRQDPAAIRIARTACTQDPAANPIARTMPDPENLH